MKIYCEGTNCKKRDTCAKHQAEENVWYEYIDWSTYGGGHYWTDAEGNNHSETWWNCGDNGNYKLYERVENL